ncbi:hypothetical protein GBAR_LOCUS22288 [Geodia barretti]|uniref:Uncharacterized protein n=1 Tax=Geodia barretti TaxID=519541 RepID=A0AA35T1X0_GEOBA|nr:hypothetical protein GBAR_LOCUS22288 [Geodia barretti]
MASCVGTARRWGWTSACANMKSGCTTRPVGLGCATIAKRPQPVASRKNALNMPRSALNMPRNALNSWSAYSASAGSPRPAADEPVRPAR